MVLPVMIDHHHHAHSSYDKEAKRLLTQRGSVWCWIWTAVGLWAVAAAAGESNGTKAVYRVVLGSPELVLDTVGIVDAVEGVTLEQHTPQKSGMVIAQDHPWEAGMYFYSSVVQTENQIMLYYGCSGPANTTANFLCVAVSADGITFTKPTIGTIEYDGSTANNIVWATPYGPQGHAGTGWSNAVLFDSAPNVPPAEKFKMLFDTDQGEFAGRELLVAVSSDGLHWAQLLMSTSANGAVVPRTNFGDTCAALVWIERLGRYAVFGRHDSPTVGAVCVAGDSYGNFRQVAMVIEATHTETNHHGESEPPVSFSTRSFNETPTVVFHTKLGVDPGCVDYYNPSPIDRSGVTFIFPAATRHLNQPKKNGTAFPSPYTSCRTMNDGMLDVRMAFSRLADPSNATFTRVSTAPVVSRGMGSRSPSTGLFNVAGSDWDAGMVFMATGIVELESEPWHMSMYYFGGQVTHGFEAYHLGESYPDAIRGYGRLKWRRDGFVSLSTPFDGSVGSVITKPILINLASLANMELRILLNVETSVSGQVLVDVMVGSEGLPHFQSLPVVGNSVQATVIFNASLVGNANFTCGVENQPSAMPDQVDVTLQTDVSAAVRLAGDDGLRLRISLQDARLFSVTFVQVPVGSPVS
eukprot:m.19932 g.19932  ORF g.19932 m.19932 type:complete len:637 (+) comp10068_c0_seq1:208-2118(+)